jgi:acyl-CoA thioester hydrolase
MPGIDRFDIQVPPEAVDGNGHVNNVVYVQWMQDAAIRHSDATGCTRMTTDIGATWVVRTHHVEYASPAFGGDTVLVQTWVADFRKVRSLRKYRFVRASDGTLLARGETDWVFVDARTGRPRAIPDAIKDAFTVVPPEREP